MTCKYGCTATSTEPKCPDHGDVKGQRVVMPNGVGVYYVDADHSYWRMRPDNWNRGQRLTGVTTLTKALDTDNTHLLKWAARTNGIGIAQLAAPVIAGLAQGDGNYSADDLSWLTSSDGIWQRLVDERLTYDDVRDAKGATGTRVHELVFQALAEGRPVPHLDELHDDERGYARAAMGFWLDHEPVAELVEQVLVSDKLGAAGRVDFVGRLTSRCADEACPCQSIDLDTPGVLDAKTGRYLGASAHAQVQGYRVLAGHAGYDLPGWAALLHLRPDGTYRLVASAAEMPDFLVAVEAYRTVGRIDRQARAAS